jgi:cytochrome c5
MRIFCLLATFALALPAAIAATPPERTGEQIVKSQCARCHESGLHGAPRIDDRAAWTPRMKEGIDATVRSAIRGHGKMPARGGLADLTDTELRAAILYLFNPAGIPPKPAAAPAPGPNQKVVDGTEIYLGIARKSGDLHQVSITLRDSQTHTPIENAQVEVKVTNPVMGAQTRKLEAMKAGGVVSYAGDFRISGKETHVVTVQVRRPAAARLLEASFDYKN